MTWAQLCNAWWNFRPLSLTSSAVDKLIIAAAPRIDANHPQRRNFEYILKYNGQLSLFLGQDSDVNNDNDDL